MLIEAMGEGKVSCLCGDGECVANDCLLQEWKSRYTFAHGYPGVGRSINQYGVVVEEK